MTPAGLEPVGRVRRLLEAARRATLPGSESRARLCAELVTSTRLSPEGIEWALARCLELEPSSAELDALVSSVPPSPRAHVILPSNVFIAPHRAVALALASAPHVFVKPSRREPAFVRALAAADPGLFEIVAELPVRAGDHVWAYGSDSTLEALRRELPRGAVLHANGDGFGVVVVDLTSGAAGKASAVAAAVARDVACFDQRGCLSPRFALAQGSAALGLAFARHLAQALAEMEARVPRGALDADELADATWYEQCAACFGPVLRAGSGAVSVRSDLPVSGSGGALEVPPSGRYIEVIALEDARPLLAALAPWLTAVGVSGRELEAAVRSAAPRARVSAPGAMHAPAFDGPVDRRSDRAGELLR